MPRTADELTVEVTEILSKKEGLSREAIQSILADVKGRHENDDGELDGFLEVLRDEDVVFLEDKVKLRKEIGGNRLDIVELLTEHLPQVRPH